MTTEEIDKKGFKVKFLKRAVVARCGVYYVALLEKNKKLYVSWKPEGHKEYTTPFYVAKSDKAAVAFPGLAGGSDEI